MAAILLLFCVACGLAAKIDVYGAFIRGAKEGAETAAGILPYLTAIFCVSGLLRAGGLLETAENALAPLLETFGIPRTLAGLLLLRPLSGSAALGICREIMETCGADSREGFLACVICGGSETVFYVSALYFGAAEVKKTRYAIPAALAAYAAGALAAGRMY